MPMVRFWQWSAYFAIENETPTTTERILAQIASFVGSKWFKGTHKAADFLPSVNKNKKEFTKNEGAGFIKSLAGMLGAKVK